MDDEAETLAALGHPSRLAILRLLARRSPSGADAGDIAVALGVKANVASTHLATLTRAGLIGRTRAGRHIRYRLDIARVSALLSYIVHDCLRGRPDVCAPLASALWSTAQAGGSPMTNDRVFNVLFICTGNSARSIFAEALMNDAGQGRFRAFSAGTKPYSELNPYAVAQLDKLGHDVSGLRAKTVAEFQGPDAPRLDFVFTVCDNAANEECPPWPGQPINGHWGIPDPVRATGTDAEKKLAFADAYRMLKHRIASFVSLPVESLDAISLQREIDQIGAIKDAPSAA